MKNIIIVLLSLSTLSLAALCIMQTRKAAQEQAQVTEQRATLESAQKAIATLQQDQAENEQRQRELLRRSDELVTQARREAILSNALAAKRLAAAAAASEAPATDKDENGFGSMLSKMMSDPDTKKLIQQTQRAMMDQLYGPLVKQMGLSPEEAQKFKDLLADNAGKATSVFGALGSTNRAELASQVTEMQKGFEAQLKAFLGDARFEQYQDYQKTVGERTQLNQFKQQLGADQPLTDQQTDQLLALMKDEHQNVATSLGLPTDGPERKAADLEMMFSDEKLQTFLDSYGQANQRIYDRASQLLTPDQLQAFGSFQTNQLQMMRMGMTMARKMFGTQNKAQ